MWHRAVVTSVNTEKKICSVRLEHGVKAGEKRKATHDEYDVSIEDIFPLNSEFYFYVEAASVAGCLPSVIC